MLVDVLLDGLIWASLSSGHTERSDALAQLTLARLETHHKGLEKIYHVETCTAEQPLGKLWPWQASCELSGPGCLEPQLDKLEIVTSLTHFNCRSSGRARAASDHIAIFARHKNGTSEVNLALWP